MVILDQDAATSQVRKIGQPLVTFKPDEARFAGLPNFIFGLHDPNGEAHMLDAEKPGWVVVSARVGPPDPAGDFSPLAEKGIGVIVRLNNGYASAGTIPNSTQYDRFALRCAQYVGGSKGAHFWIIGNAPNAALERPGNDGTDNSGEVIIPEMYANCFIRCRKAIRALPGHENDWVIPAAVAPFNTQTNYPKNPSGDWIRYFADVLFQISAQRGGLDGLALHTYTHGGEASLIASEEMAGGHFPSRHRHFRAYRDFLAAIPPALRNLPVFITEAQPTEPGWTGQNRNWIQSACAEINSWNLNRANQPIQALCFFRWQIRDGDPAGLGIADKEEVVQDFTAALQNDYRVRWPGFKPKPDHRAEWIVLPGVPEKGIGTNEVFTGRVAVRNAGAKAWLSEGSSAVRLGYRWFDPKGTEIPPLPEAEQFSLVQNILPGQTAIIDRVEFRAPREPGSYILRCDLVQERDAWFGAHDSPTKDLIVTVIAPAYAVEWDQVVQVIGNKIGPNANLMGRVQVKNIGSTTWQKGGARPVRLGYRWYDLQGLEVPVVPYAGDFDLEDETPPGETATFEDIVLRSPQRDGTFSLVWDLIQEGVTWFGAKGAETSSQWVTIAKPIPDLAAKWMSAFKIPNALEPNETVSGPISVQNAGFESWNASGENPVRLTVKWYDPLGNQIPCASYSGDYPLAHDVPPGENATIDAVRVHAPIPQGKYNLVFDMEKEGVTFFSSTGSRPYDIPIDIKTSSPNHFAEWIEKVEVPENTLIVGEILTGRVVVRNAGAMMWNSRGDNAAKLGYRWYNAAGAEIGMPADKFPLGKDVPPRESAVFDDVRVQAPDLAGDYTLKLDLMREGQGWFEEGGSPPGVLSISIQSPPLGWGAEFIAHDTPPSLSVGQETVVNLQIKNIGRNPWRMAGENSVFASYKWLNSAGETQPDVETHRKEVSRDTPPGRTAGFAVLLAAPLTPGAYRLQWDLIAEGDCWFAEGGNPPLVVSANVTEAPTQTNLWRAEASHNASSAFLAIDGDLSSFWSSQSSQTPGMWFRVNLGTLRLIDGIAIRSPGNGYPSGYSLPRFAGR